MPIPLDHRNYTYEDYLNYPQDERIELIDGQIYAMSPSPSRIHQDLIFQCARKVADYIDENKGKCKVYVAPFDVRFLNDNEEENYCENTVQPDISVICDTSKLDEKGCLGSPDLIMEIVSPSNASMDYILKLNLYNRFKVKEYWIINPMNKKVLVYKMNGGSEFDAPVTYTFQDKIKVGIFEGLFIEIDRLLI